MSRAKPVTAKKKAPAKKPGTAMVKAGTAAQAVRERKAAFAQAYIANGGNATEAAITAGYSPRTAGQQGYRLLKDVEVSTLVQQSAKNVAQKYELNTDLVVRSIVQEITFDPGCLYRDDGTLRDLHELTQDQRMALAGVEFATEGNPKDGFTYVRKIKWAAKATAREQAMKHLGMFEADNSQKALLGEGAPRQMLEMLRTALEHRLRQLGMPVPTGARGAGA